MIQVYLTDEEGKRTPITREKFSEVVGRLYAKILDHLLNKREPVLHSAGRSWYGGKGVIMCKDSATADWIMEALQSIATDEGESVATHQPQVWKAKTSGFAY